MCSNLSYGFTCDLDARNAENNTKAEEPETLTPLYSIGTPSTSDENLFEDLIARTGDGTPTGISREEPLKDDSHLKILGIQIVDLHGDLTDGQLEAAAEMTKPDTLKRLEESGDIVESETFFDSIESTPEIPNVNMNDSFAVTSYSMSSSACNSACQPDSNEQADRDKEHRLKQVPGGLNSVSDLERCNLDLSQENGHSLYGASEKLNIALQRLKSQLTMLR